MAAKIKDSPVPVSGCGCGSQSSSIQSDWYINKSTNTWFYKGKDTGIDSSGPMGPKGDPPTLVVKNVQELRDLSDKDINGLKSGEYKGVQVLGYYEEGDTPASIIYYLSDTVEPEDGGSVFEVKDIKLEHRFEVINSFLYFGVKGGDLNVDDGFQLKKLFTYASNNRINVSNSLGEYYLKETRGIPIKSNVDFGKSVFHVHEEFDNSLNGRFDVLPDAPVIDVVLPVGFIDFINSGGTYLNFLEAYKNHYFIIENTNQYINRNGGSGGRQYLSEMFFVADNGTIITEITGKLTDYTSCKAYPVSSYYLDIKGGVFLLNCETSTAGYKLSGFNCTRSRVTFRDQIVGYEDGVNYADNMSPDFGFHYFLRTYDSKLINTQTVSRANEGSAGTYGLGVRYTTKMLIEDVDTAYGDNAWGYMGGYIVKDLVVRNSSLSRIDVHFSAYNVTIENTYTNFIALEGGGLLKMDGVKVRNNVYLPFRQDYGSRWDGDIVITNGTMINNTNLRARILNYQYEDFDFGLEQYLSLCKSLKIDGFTYIHKNPTQVRLNIIDVSSNKMITVGNNRVKFPTYVELRNMKSVGNDGYCVFGLENLVGAYVPNTGGLVDGVLQTNCTIIVDSIDISVNNNVLNHSNGVTQSGVNEVYPKFEFRNCRNIKVNTASILADIKFINCTINSYRNINANSSQTFTECNIEVDRVGTISSAITAVSDKTRYVNCTWDTPKLNGVKVITVSDINTILGTSGGIQFGAVGSEAIYKSHINSTLSSDLLTKLASASSTPSVFMNKRLSLNKLSDTNIIYREYGTTVQRPTLTSSVIGFYYFNTESSKLEIWNGSSWVNLTPDATMSTKGIIEVATQTETILGTDDSRAVTPFTLHALTPTTTRKGLVNQTSALANISQPDLVSTTSPVATVDTASTATDVAGLLTDLNDLISKYNVAVALINELKTKYDLNVVLTNAIKTSQNTELTNQRTAGQQAP